MRIMTLILVIGLVFGMASYSAACLVAGEPTDKVIYSCLYPCTASTVWIPGTDVGVAEIAVKAQKVLTP